MQTPTLTIRTPEGVVFSQTLAGPLARFCAWSIDLLCILALLTALGFLTAGLSLIAVGFAAAASAIGYFVVSIGYGISCEWFWRGQTVGKRLMRLRVMDAEGMRLRLDQVVTRNLLRFVDSLPLLYFVGGVAVWLGPRCQRLGDIAGNTVVVKIPQISEPDIGQLLAGKFNSLRQHPHLAARLRQNVSPEEAALAAQTLLRRDQLTPQARLQVFSQFAQHFRQAATFPQEATEGLGDEQYIRNVVDILYRTRI